MTVCMLLEAPQATTGSLDPYGPPSVMLFSPAHACHSYTQAVFHERTPFFSTATVPYTKTYFRT